MRIVRYALAVLLAAIAAFLTVAAAGALSDSLRNHEDMSGAAYVGFGVGYLAAVLALLTVGSAAVCLKAQARP